jgi:hypothetical protein
MKMEERLEKEAWEREERRRKRDERLKNIEDRMENEAQVRKKVEKKMEEKMKNIEEMTGEIIGMLEDRIMEKDIWGKEIRISSI